MQRVAVIDSHTGGEPTRLVLGGGPDLGTGTMAQRLARFRDQHDDFRRAVVQEPRGSDVIVGGLLCAPPDAGCAAGVIFFNNVGYLGMCGHGTIGLCATLAHLGRIGTGPQSIATPVGVVQATWHGGGDASVVNVPSFRKARAVAVNVPGAGTVCGDVAWGGNWFFLVEHPAAQLVRENIGSLTALGGRIRQALNAQGFPEVDHVEFFAHAPGADARNFVLCPGQAYDRSPCGTGTSAKLACLAADGTLPPGAPWVQESIIGSRFHGSYQWQDRARGIIVPTIRGTAFITAESTLLLDPADPFCHGMV